MRVNVNEPGAWWRYSVYLDGVFVEYCVEADDEQGYVIVERPVGDTFVQERKEGTVRIESLPKDAP